MKAIKDYIIDFNSLSGDQNKVSLSYHLTKDFFSQYDEFPIIGGDVQVQLEVNRISFGHFILNIELFGTVETPCDRCLDPLTVNIESKGELKVRYGMDIQMGGETYSTIDDESSEYDFTLMSNDTTLDLSWSLYELVELALPLQNIHPEGECNSNMEDLLQEHIALLPGEVEGDSDDSEEITDPRWDALKNILNNN